MRAATPLRDRQRTELPGRSGGAGEALPWERYSDYTGGIGHKFYARWWSCSGGIERADKTYTGPCAPCWDESATTPFTGGLGQ